MEPLKDPENDRVMKDIVPPPHKPISDEVLYPNKGKHLIIISKMFLQVQTRPIGSN